MADLNGTLLFVFFPYRDSGGRESSFWVNEVSPDLDSAQRHSLTALRQVSSWYLPCGLAFKPEGHQSQKKVSYLLS